MKQERKAVCPPLHLRIWKFNDGSLTANVICFSFPAELFSCSFSKQLFPTLLFIFQGNLSHMWFFLIGLICLFKNVCPQIWLFFFLITVFCVEVIVQDIVFTSSFCIESPSFLYHLFLHRSPNVCIAGPEITNVFFFFLPTCLGHLIWHNLVHILERLYFLERSVSGFNCSWLHHALFITRACSYWICFV